MKKIEERFNSRYKRSNLRLPPEDVRNRQRGNIVGTSMIIRYLFGSDEKGEYLDFLESSKMGGDAHKRIYEDGSEEWLPTPMTFHRVFPDDPERTAQSEAEYFAHNQRVGKLLRGKGFQ